MLFTLPPHAWSTIFLVQLQILYYDIISFLLPTIFFKRMFPLLIYTLPNSSMVTKKCDIYHLFSGLQITTTQTVPSQIHLWFKMRYLSPIFWLTHYYYKNPAFRPSYTIFLVSLYICLFRTPPKLNTYHNSHLSSGKHIFAAPYGYSMINSWLHIFTASEMKR